MPNPLNSMDVKELNTSSSTTMTIRQGGDIINDNFLYLEEKLKEGISTDPGDDSLPGPGEIQSYDEATDTGYYGEVSDFLTGDELHSLTGLSAGIAHNNDAGWLKFYVGSNATCNRDPQGRAYIAYVAKKSFRYDITWDDINAVNLVYGDTTVTHNNIDYECRLLTGADKDPSTYTSGTSCADNAGVNSEWSMLMYRVHQDIPDCSDPTIGMRVAETTRHGGPQNGSNWATFTDSDLNTNVGDGRATWCQETDGGSSTWRVLRGFYGVAYFITAAASTLNDRFGYRPVLVKYI